MSTLTRLCRIRLDFVEATLAALKDELRIAVLEGDLQTERDAERIRRQGVDALQITTGGICHLEAQMIQQAMERLDLDNLDLIFIENVGNLVCPASYDLGEDIRATLVSVTEGDDKPKKYPSMFLTTDLMLVTKSDLLPYVPFSVDAVIQDAREVNADIEPLVLSALKSEGMEPWCDLLRNRVAAKRAEATA